MQITLPRWTPDIEGWQYRIHWKIIPPDHLSGAFVGNVQWNGRKVDLIISYQSRKRKWWNVFLISRKPDKCYTSYGESFEDAVARMKTYLKVI